MGIEKELAENMKDGGRRGELPMRTNLKDEIRELEVAAHGDRDFVAEHAKLRRKERDLVKKLADIIDGPQKHELSDGLDQIQSKIKENLRIIEHWHEATETELEDMEEPDEDDENERGGES